MPTIFPTYSPFITTRLTNVFETHSIKLTARPEQSVSPTTSTGPETTAHLYDTGHATSSTYLYGGSLWLVQKYIYFGKQNTLTISPTV